MIKKILYIAAWSILCLIAGIVIGCLSCQPEPQKVTVYSTDTLVEYKYKDPETICDTVIVSKTDTVFIDSSTTIGEIPMRTHRQSYIRTLISGNKKSQLKQTVETDYIGVIFAQRMTPENDTFTVDLADESALRLCGSVGLGYVNEGSIYAPAKIGLMFKKRVSISGTAGYLRQWYVGGLLEVHF